MAEPTQTGYDNLGQIDLLAQRIADGARSIESQEGKVKTGLEHKVGDGIGHIYHKDSANRIMEFTVNSLGSIAIGGENFDVDVNVAASKSMEDTMFIDIGRLQNDETAQKLVDEMNARLPEGSEQAKLIDPPEGVTDIDHTIQVPVSAMKGMDFDALFDQIGNDTPSIVKQAQIQQRLDLRQSPDINNVFPGEDKVQAGSPDIEPGALDNLLDDNVQVEAPQNETIVQQWDPAENGYAQAMTNIDPNCDACSINTQFTAATSGEFNNINPNPTAPAPEELVVAQNLNQETPQYKGHGLG